MEIVVFAIGVETTTSKASGIMLDEEVQIGALNRFNSCKQRLFLNLPKVVEP